MPASKRIKSPKKTTIKKADIAEAEIKKTIKSDLKRDQDSPRKINPLIRLRKFFAWFALLGLILLLFFAFSKFFVVAWVNKKPITRVEYYNLLEQKYGEQIKDQLIKEQLLADEASKRKINITQEDINNEVKKVEGQVGGSDQLKQELELRGIKQTDFQKIMKNQLLIQKVFGTDVNVTDQDVNTYIEQNKNQLPPTVDDKTKEQIKDFLKQQKTQEKYEAWQKDALSSKQVVRVK